jgi:hypothetical protein
MAKSTSVTRTPYSKRAPRSSSQACSGRMSESYWLSRVRRTPASVCMRGNSCVKRRK